ncbi:hypothetical protein [Nostoc sp. DedQUE09]|nr:hypothetical protein [Nostoc sp. DedQUE09]MDZ7951112.1 hypothetical protein [Nostoc sp. DedQUE09]
MVARFLERSIPFTTSATVECRPKGVAIGAISTSSLLCFENVSDRLEFQ